MEEVDAPRNLSRNSLVTWIITILTAVVGVLFGFWVKAQSDLLEKETKRADKAEIEKDRLQSELSKCQNEKNLYEVIHRFGVAPGKKTVEVTPEQQNNSYEE